MPYRLFELQSKTREQLETIANELNVKNIKKLDDENLAYAILDSQAKEESVKPVAEKPKGRRGRPPKQKTTEAQEAPAQENAAADAAVAGAADTDAIDPADLSAAIER